jgi:hypothetical protein
MPAVAAIAGAKLPTIDSARHITAADTIERLLFAFIYLNPQFHSGVPDPNTKKAASDSAPSGHPEGSFANIHAF